MSFYRLDDDRLLDAQERESTPIEDMVLCACGDTFPDGEGVRIGPLFICPACAKEHPVLVGELQAALQADIGRDDQP